MFGIYDINSYTYRDSIRDANSIRNSDGMTGKINFLEGTVDFESGLEKIFATMMAIDQQVMSIMHQPLTFFYRVTTVDSELHYTTDYRVIRDCARPDLGKFHSRYRI